MPRDRAAQRVRFFEQYRSYVINYNYGKDLVRQFIEKRGGTPDHPDEALAGVRDAVVVAAASLRVAVSWIRTRLLWLAAVACLAGYVHAYTGGRAGTPIRSDAFSYYVYLPSWALFHDPVAAGASPMSAAAESFPRGPRSCDGRSRGDGSTRIRSAWPSWSRRSSPPGTS